MEAVAAKYRLATLHYDEFYTKLLRPKLTDFLIDEPKRFSKRHAREIRHDVNNNDPRSDDNE
jgi:hypothetical protein